MKARGKAAFFSDYGLFKKGDIIEVKEKDFDSALMEPVEQDPAPADDPKEETKKSPAKRGRKKEA